MIEFIIETPSRINSKIHFKNKNLEFYIANSFNQEKDFPKTRGKTASR